MTLADVLRQHLCSIAVIYRGKGRHGPHPLERSSCAHDKAWLLDAIFGHGPMNSISRQYGTGGLEAHRLDQ
eukprot:6060897-Amphidinium_carterae.1